MSRSAEVIVPKKGRVRAIYSTLADKLLSSLGETETRRATHVDTGQDLRVRALNCLLDLKKIYWGHYQNSEGRRLLVSGTGEQIGDVWWADCTPSPGGSVLGPFDTLEEALEAELVWLRENNIPIFNDQPYTAQIQPLTSRVLDEDQL